MQNEPRECYHVAIILPDNSLYDGGVGVHSEKIYLDKGLDIVVMDEYDYQLLDKHSYGLDRDYPRYCPDFDLQEFWNWVAEVSCWLKFGITNKSFWINYQPSVFALRATP